MDKVITTSMCPLFLSTALLLAAGLAAEQTPADHLLGNSKAPAGEEAARQPGPPRRVDRGDRASSEERGERPQVEERRREFMRERIERMKDSGITREEMQKLRSALEQVSKTDAVKASRAEAQKAREALRTALEAYAKSKGIPLPGPRTEGSQPEPLSPEKMSEVRKAMEQARNDLAVKAAFEKAREVGKSLRETVRAELLKQDASLAPILEKLGDSREGMLEFAPERGQRGQRQGEGEGQGEGKGPRGSREGMGPRDEQGPREEQGPSEGKGFRGPREGRGFRGPRPEGKPGEDAPEAPQPPVDAPSGNPGA